MNWKNRLKINMPKLDGDRKHMDKQNSLIKEREQLCMELGNETFKEEFIKARKLQVCQRILTINNELAASAAADKAPDELVPVAPASEPVENVPDSASQESPATQAPPVPSPEELATVL